MWDLFLQDAASRMWNVLTCVIVCRCVPLLLGAVLYVQHFGRYVHKARL